LFSALDAGVLTAVDVGFVYNNIDYEILVYDSFSGSQPGNLIGSKSGQINNAGWHTINFDSEINISNGQNFFVAVKILSQTFAISYDAFGQITGRSYISGDGINYSSSIGQNGDINLRARILTNTSTSIENLVQSLQKFSLEQNFPNPFNPETRISYQLPESGKVNLSVFDINGRLVATLVNEQQIGGQYSVIFNADQLASGVYIYKIATEKFSDTRKMLLVK